MAQKFYLYTADDEITQWGIPMDDGIMAMYDNIVKQYDDWDGDPSAQTVQAAGTPSAYDSLALLIDDNTTAVAKPNGVQLRGLTLNLPGFGSLFMPILNTIQTVTPDVALVKINGGAFAATIGAYVLSQDEGLPMSTSLQLGGDGPYLAVAGYNGERKFQ